MQKFQLAHGNIIIVIILILIIIIIIIIIGIITCTIITMLNLHSTLHDFP